MDATTFTHRVRFNKFSGSLYDRGKQLGSYVRSQHENKYIDWQLSRMKHSFLYAALGMHFELSETFIRQNAPVIEQLLKSIHPLLLEEIRGFADGLEEDYRKTLVFVGTYGGGTGCSHFYANGFHGHNYDDTPQNVDNQFLLVQGEGIHASFGASAGYVGRLDGMNDQGLAVSLSFGAGHISERPGIGAILLERIILDKAASVQEALAIFNEVGYISPNNVLICDASGNAVIIEMSNGKHRMRDVKDRVLYCANSYMHSDMKSEQKHNNPTTSWREAKMQEVLAQADSKDKLLQLLASDFPKGLYEPYFADELGTLWSVLYDLKGLAIDLAVGEESDQGKSLHIDLKDQMQNFTLPNAIEVSMKDTNFSNRAASYSHLMKDAP